MIPSYTCRVLFSSFIFKGYVKNEFYVIVKSTFVSVFTIKRSKGTNSENPWRRNGEYTEQLYSKHLSV